MSKINCRLNRNKNKASCKRNSKIVYEKVCKGVKFQIKETGLNWTIYAKEKRKKSFNRVQSVTDLKLAKQIVENQRECRS